MSLIEINTAAFDKAHDLTVSSTQKQHREAQFVGKLASLLTDEHETLHPESFDPKSFRDKCAEILGELKARHGINFLIEITDLSRSIICSALEFGLAKRVSVTPPSLLKKSENPLENKPGY